MEERECFTFCVLKHKQGEREQRFLEQAENYELSDVTAHTYPDASSLYHLVFMPGARVLIHYPNVTSKVLREQLDYTEEQADLCKRRWGDLFDIRLSDGTVLWYARSIDMHLSTIHLMREGKA